MAPSGDRPLKAGPGDILVLGGGHFGHLAAQRLAGRVLAVAELNPQPGLEYFGAEIWPKAGLVAAREALASPLPPAWIVPCIPTHFLVDWLLAELAEQSPIPLPVPREAEASLPVVGRGPQGQLYLSITNTLCPDDCSEPAARCSKTGQKRGQPLFARIRELSLAGWQVAALRSHQLAPGVGGLAVAEMRQLRERLAGQGGRWLVGTACRCHGVLSGLEINARGVAGKSQP